MANLSCDALYAKGQSLWPRIALSPAAFAAFVARLDRPLAPELAGDVYLCCACARGDDAALRAFEERYFPRIDRTLAGMQLGAHELDEVRQQVREKLFVGQGGEPPKIAEYAGRGDLETLIKVIATRMALNLVRTRRRRHEAGDEPLLFAVDDRDDPEIVLLKERLRAGFQDAIRNAVQSLPPRQRTLLRLQLVDGLTIDDLGVLYGVHRATAARWLTAAKEALIRVSMRHLERQLGLSGDALASAQRLVHSQIDLSLSRLFRDP